MRIKDSYKTIGAGIAIVAALSGGVRGCNMAWNNRSTVKPAYQTESRAGLYGHVEFTRYSDDSMDVKEYLGFAHRLFDSKLHQDLNGDGLVDRIRLNGAEWKMNHLSELLVREHDYDLHKNRFDEADTQLQDLMAKYPAKK
jgi:hypothetical protein